MGRLDIYRGPVGLVLDCQSDLLSALNTRFVAPLLPEATAPLPARRLNPVFEIEGQRYVMVTQFAAAIPVRELGERVTSLIAEDAAIGNAIDMLVSGY